ncbi:uncharacterized protein METZ01_LOCUS281893, partial [marine metagenome]
MSALGYPHYRGYTGKSNLYEQKTYLVYSQV